MGNTEKNEKSPSRQMLGKRRRATLSLEPTGSLVEEKKGEGRIRLRRSSATLLGCPAAATAAAAAALAPRRAGVTTSPTAGEAGSSLGSSPSPTLYAPGL